MPRQIFLFTNVNKMSAEVIIRQLLDLDRESNEEITMFINSNGGSVTDLFSILNTMEMVKSPIRTVVIGMAASAAAVIASAGNTRLITSDSEVMIHEVFSVTFGNSSQIQEDFERLQKMENKLLNKLSKYTNKDSESLKKLIKNKDRYFTAQEAVRFGLSDKIIQSNEAQILKLSEQINTEGKEVDFKDEGLSEVEILMEGKFFHPVYGDVVITENVFDKMIKNFRDKVRGIDLSLDYTHDNESGEQPAAAWIRDLKISNEGKNKKLLAQVEFTPKGKRLVEEKEYKYVSADFSIDYVDQNGKHSPYVLRGGTLTNRPFIKEMNPIKLSEYSLKDKKENKEITKMDREELINALKENFGVDVEGMTADNESLKGQITELQNKVRELNALPAQKDEEIATLKQKIGDLDSQIVKNEKEKVFNKLLDEGKVTPAQKDKVLNSFDTPEKIDEFYKDSPKVVNTEAKGKDGEGKDETLTDAEQALVNSGEYTKEEIIKNRKVS